jgi:hypothetical protein
MKLNWGHKIILVFLVFVIGMLFLVYKSSQQKMDLVQKDYYADELKYQEVINASKNAKEIGGELKVIRKGGHLLISLPAGLHSGSVKGIAHLYYAADENKDISKSFTTSTGEFEMELFTMMNGNYTLKLNLEWSGKEYYYEQKLSF